MATTQFPELDYSEGYLVQWDQFLMDRLLKTLGGGDTYYSTLLQFPVQIILMEDAGVIWQIETALNYTHWYEADGYLNVYGVLEPKPALYIHSPKGEGYLGLFPQGVSVDCSSGLYRARLSVAYNSSVGTLRTNAKFTIDDRLLIRRMQPESI